MQRCGSSLFKPRAFLKNSDGTVTGCDIRRLAGRAGLRLIPLALLSLIFPRTAEASLYFPHVTHAGAWDTEICVVNTSDVLPLTGRYLAYSNAGLTVGRTAPVTLWPHERAMNRLTELFPASEDVGYVVFDTASLTASGFARVGVANRYLASIPGAAKANSGDFFITHIAALDDWWTSISFVNTTPIAKQLSVEFNNGVTKTVDLPASGRVYLDVQQWFGGQPQPALQSAVVRNGSGVVGSELFGSTDRSAQNYMDGLLLEDETATRLYFPHLAQDDFWWTGIVVFNPSAVNCSLRLTPHRNDGTPLQAITQTLKPHERYVGLLSTLKFPADAAWVEVEGSVPITGFELFATQNGDMMAGYTGVSINSREGVFPTIDKLSYTGIAFVNISSSAALVTLTAYDDLGAKVGVYTKSLQPYAKEVGFTMEWFPPDTPDYTSLRYSADQPIVAFQLNLSAALTTLDAFAAGIRSRSITVADGNVGYSNGLIASPGATIISQGQSMDAVAAVAPDSIVAIRKNGKTYLYHPALGTAPLSDTTSRRAVGYFLSGLIGGPSSAPGITGLNAGIFPNGEDRISLKTGVDLSYEGQESALLIRAVNGTRRWAVAKGDYAGELPRYLPLRASTIPTEIFDVLEKIYEHYETTPIKLIGNVTGAVVKANPSGVVKTYGSFARAIPFYMNKPLPPEFAQLTLADAEILARVTVLDYFYTLMEGVRALAGLGSLSECADLVVQSGVPRFLQTIYVQRFTGDEGATAQLYDATLKSSIHSGIGCMAALGTAGTGEVVNTLLDIVTGLNWIIEDTLFTTFHSVFSYSHFSTVSVGAASLAFTSYSATPAVPLETGKNGLVTLRCTTRGVNIVRGDASAIGGPAIIEFVQKGQDPITQDTIWEPAAAINVRPVVPGDQKVKFYGSISTGESTTAYATVKVKLVISEAAVSGSLYLNKRGTVHLSCTAFGATSAVADLSAINGPAALELYGGADTGEYSLNPEVTPLHAGLMTITFKASANSASAEASATILVKSGELEYSGYMSVERMHTTLASYGCAATGSCTGTLPLTLTLKEDGSVIAHTSLPLAPPAQLNCNPVNLTCEVKVVQLQDFSGTHDGKGNFSFYFWRPLPEAPDAGEFKVTGTYSTDEAIGTGDKTYSNDSGSYHVKLSFTLRQ